MSINVNRNLDDQFYRYKMPRLSAKVEGKGNGIKTVIVNMVDIAKALNRPPMYPTKYFGCILGAQVNCDVKNERYIVNGSHESNKLQDILDGFIQKYVLCSSCQNPETVLTAHPKKGVIQTQCKACGYCTVLPNKDRLTTYILKYPPPSSSGTSTTPSGKKDKKNKKKDKNDKDKGSSDESDEFNNELSKLDKSGDDIDDDWCEDTDPESVAKRARELSAQTKSLTLNADLDRSSDERLQIFYDFVSKKKEELKDSFNVSTQKDIVAEAVRLDVRDKAVLILCELLFDEKILQQIKNHASLFKEFTRENPKAQKYLLSGIELIIKIHSSSLMQKVLHILNAFYDADIIEENALIEWAEKKSKKAVGKEIALQIHEKAAPFIKWLKEAEEASDDSDNENGSTENDDNDDDDDDIVYDENCKSIKIETVKVEPKKKNGTVPSSEGSTGKSNNNSNNNDDDIDIDAI